MLRLKVGAPRALQLCKESGLDEHTFPAVFGLWTWNFVRLSLAEAQALAERLLNSAETVDDAVYKVLAHEALGFTLFAQGKFAAAHAELERTISMCEDSAAAAYLELSAQDPRVHARLYDGMALHLLGYPDQALRICAEARLYADASRHPFSEAMSRVISLRVHQFRGEAAVVAGQSTAAVALCEEHEFVHYRAMALVLRGWASAQQGEFQKGIAEIQEGLKIERATGALLYESYILGLLADACIKNDRYEQALEVLNQARLRLDEKNSERFYAAEIYRLLGEAYLRSDQDLFGRVCNVQIATGSSDIVVWGDWGSGVQISPLRPVKSNTYRRTGAQSPSLGTPWAPRRRATLGLARGRHARSQGRGLRAPEPRVARTQVDVDFTAAKAELIRLLVAEKTPCRRRSP